MSAAEGRRIRHVEGRGIALRGDDVDTDRIIPARFLRAVRFEGLEEHVFEDDRLMWTGAKPHPFDDPRFTGASVLVVNRNFGCGSSREHAPQALQRWGITAIVGESFSEIFFGNAVAIGLPCVTAAPADVAWLQEAIERDAAVKVSVDLEVLRVTCSARALALSMPAAVADAFRSGAWDATGLLLDDFAQVDAVAARLPYVTGF
jgi:3-isopropylmalate/(R)-2-methylmalate dehydratase small subunit